MKLLNRDTLKNFFVTGSQPSQGNFSNLIDSMVNKVDDGFSKDMEHGLMLSPMKSGNSLISFFQTMDNPEPDWSVRLNPDDKTLGLDFGEPNTTDDSIQSRVFMQRGGNVGIGTQQPKFLLDVNGTAGMQTRIGTYPSANATNTVPADGRWHTILSGLNNCQAFEIVAQTGLPKHGKYALLHAIALSTFGRSRSKIRKTQAHYGFWWNKIAIRWTGSTFDYGLEIRTRSNYGTGININYNITRLWESPLEQQGPTTTSASGTTTATQS